METKIDRANLMAKRAEVESEIKSLNAKKFEYAIKRDVEGGVIPQLPSAVQCVELLGKVKRRFAFINEASEELGIQTEASKFTYKGYAYSDIVSDLKLRIEELGTKERIDKLEKALVIIDKNLSDDDKFNMEMSKLSELL